MTSARWTIAVGWMTAMALVWAVFVPNPMSSVVFTLIAAGGLFVMLCGAALLSDSQAPRSVTAIIADLEAGGRARVLHTRNR